MGVTTKSSPWVSAAGGISGDHIEAYLARGGDLDALGDLYLHLLDERFGPEGRVVDKSIDMSRFMGVIAAALAKAQGELVNPEKTLTATVRSPV